MADIFPTPSTAYTLYTTPFITPGLFADMAMVVSPFAPAEAALSIAAPVMAPMFLAVAEGTTYNVPSPSLLLATTLNPAVFSEAFTSPSPPAVVPAVIVAVGANPSTLTFSVDATLFRFKSASTSVTFFSVPPFKAIADPSDTPSGSLFPSATVYLNDRFSVPVPFT